jgi:DNA invertase Pin-like site-specific DNA recombinase
MPVQVVEEFYDAAVSGADPIEGRKGFAALLDRIEGNGVRNVIVEDASRFARELIVQELGITLLERRGVKLFTAGGEDLTNSSDPTRKMMRQIAGAFAEYEKQRLVAKLKSGRERKRAETGRCEGRLPRIRVLAKLGDRTAVERYQAAVAMARRLRRANPVTHKRLSLRQISTRLAEAGHLNERGQLYNPASIVLMLGKTDIKETA